ncbi:MAG: YqaJ viral recombinase family protein [Chromatiales bacterium]|nr:YqaJ viral recombinase family protein [Chromatiales bacterium]
MGRKTGQCAPADLADNPFVQRGLALEDQARRGFEQRHDTLLLPVCAESSVHPVLRCSFDGLNDVGEPVELKIPAQKTWEAIASQGADSQAYRLYWVQVQFQIAIAEAARGWLVFDPVSHQATALEFEITRDDAFIEQELIPACLQFAEAVRTRQEPPPDPERDRYIADGEARMHWERWSSHYRDTARRIQPIEAELKALKGQLAEAQQALVELMGDFLLAEQDGLRVQRYRQQGSVDYAAVLAELHPELEPAQLDVYRRPASDRVRVTLKEEPVTGSPEPADAPRRRRRRDSAPETTEPATALEPFGYF